MASILERHAERLLEESWTGERRVYGLQGGAEAYFLALLAARTARPILAIAPTPREAENLFSDIAFFLGDSRRLGLFPSWEILPFENLSPHPESVAARLEVLYRLRAGEPLLVVSSPAALFQKVVPPAALEGAAVRLRAGQELAREALQERLVRLGFHPVPLVEERGEFSVRGGIVDLFPAATEAPLRVEFVGDRIESIRAFDPATQRSASELPEVLVLPTREFSLRGEEAEAAIREIDKRAAELEMSRQARRSLIESLKERLPFPGVEFLAAYFHKALVPLFSYFPAGALVWLARAAHVETEAERFAAWVWQRASKARDEGRFVPPVEMTYLSQDDWRGALSSFPEVRSEALRIAGPKAASAERALEIRSFLNTDLRAGAAHAAKEPSLAPVVQRVKEWQDGRCLFVAPTPADASRLKELLEHYGIAASLHPGPGALELLGSEAARAIVVGKLTQGFRLPDEGLLVLTTDDIFGTKKGQQPASRRAQPSHFITSLSELKQDDYVVHIDHGVGIYRGLKVLKVAGTEGEFLHLEYQGNDRLYLPVDRINLVQKYIGGDGAKPALDRLGGTSWERVKARTRRSVLELAHELVELYAARQVHPGHAFPPPDPFYREFEAAFEFEETPDQERAINETLQDLQKPKPADRLICGDVGYGKTEVAMRAAFLVAMAGKQVAVLSPTTVLAQQHLQTFRRRFRGYPVRIEMLSRFLSPAETREVLAGLAKGTVDIVIGTHRLLQKDVAFKDLGLVVIDEEHRFGVMHKEKLKKMRREVHVISLTATPIPRTLHMSLIGIRDLSLIQSPPPGRLAIRTYVTRYDEGVIRDAILRELSRDGQVFFLHNRVETIARMAAKVADLVPEAKIAVAHGQMRPRELETIMLDFLENRTQVLVCSAIIESGLDFPNANTIIINRADRFGLAQLYQLRGRVGRSHHRAYAYLLIPGEASLTREAEQRLKAIQELDELGGGFQLALHDLEIRGAGNLLGREQSGQIAAVGFELYTRMIEEAIRSLKGEELPPEVEPEIRIGIPAYFPHSYIPDVNQRLYFYKRLANVRRAEELAEIEAEIRDRFGPLPALAKNLFRVMELRRTLRDCLVEQLSYRDGKISILFHPQAPLDSDRLISLVRDGAGRFRLTPDRRLSIASSQPSWEGTINEVIDLLRGLRQCGT